MTASGSHKKRISKRSSLLTILQSASRSFDGLRFSSLLHKERSRMAKGMSPLRLFMRNPPRKTVPDSVDGGSSGVEATSAASQSRQPLGPITISETIGNPPIPIAEQSGGEASTPRAKSKISSQGQEKFPHLENSERHAASVNSTPDKSANLPSKVKFTWQHRHGPVTNSTTREGPPDLGTPSRPPKGSASSDGQAAASNNQDTSQTLRGCSTGGGSVQSTPKGGRSVGGKATNELENCGSQSQNSTPCKTVSRSLKYSQQGSSSNPGASGITNVRSAASQNVITRPMGYLQAVKGGAPQTIYQSFVEHHFELEEDASFWCDHNVQVIIRTRPISNSELVAQGSNRCLKQESPHTVSWLGQPESRFTFDHVAGEAVTQAKLFDVAGLPMVENCMSGYNSCMFAYGQTGSGKTHTMLGDIEHLDRNPSENRGMTPRVFEYLFGRIRKEQECRRQEHLKFFCKCSFLEIYNEQITDLLEPSSTNLQMREDATKGVYVENLSEVEVQCVQDVIQLLLQGAANRKVAATNMNRESSRSHSVFTCVVESKWENNSMTNSRYGRLHLVDLAGSERQKSSGAEGGRLKEAANINKSLSTLGLVIMILVDVANGKQRHVPYRDSKLTFLLQDSLGGNSKTIMIANVSPSSCCAMETLSTLKFAQRAKFIRNNAVINEDASGDVIALRQRIEELKGEVDRLRRESVLRISSSRVLALENSSTAAQTNATMDCSATEGFALDSVYANRAHMIPIANSDQHLRSVEAVLAGALRREQQAEDITKKLAAEIEQLNRLVRQREEDSQCSKMMLRFREEKIRRLEGIADNVLSAESFFADERKNLIDELQLIRARLDRNPELTRFAMENIRLMEELRRYQEFYDGGERDVLLEEISGLRSQLLDKLDVKLGEEQTIGKLSTPQKRALAPELRNLERENELLLIEVKNYRNELTECRNNLNSCLVANADLARQIDELQATVKEVQSERSERHEEQKEVPSLHPQQAASAANATFPESVCGLPLETEELASQQRQAPTSVEEQVSELKKQLQEAQDLISQLSSEVARSKMTFDDVGLDTKHISDGRKVNENVACVAEDDAVVRQGIQDRWEKLQEIEMRHAEEITGLQLELDIMEDVVKEERQQRSLTEQKNEELSSQLSAAVSQLEQGQALVEDGLEEEKEQRFIAEQKCEELSSQLSAAVSQLEQEHALAEDGLSEDKQQRLEAEQKCAELGSELRATLSQLEQERALAEERLQDEKRQRFVGEEKCEELSSQLSAALSQLEQVESLVEDRLFGERQQRLTAEQKSEELGTQLSAAVSQLEHGQAVAEDGLKEEKQQRLLAEQNCEELSAAVSQLEQGQVLVDARLKEEIQQRLVAEQNCEELGSRLSAAVSELDQGQALAEDRLQDEKRQRLVADERCEELSSRLSAAVCELEQAGSLMEDRVKGERQDRLIAEQKCEGLSSQLSATISQLEEGLALAKDGLNEEKQQRLGAEQKCEELSSQLRAGVAQLEQGQALAEDRLQDEKRQRLIAEEKCEELSGQLSAAVAQLDQGESLMEDRVKGERQQRLITEQKSEELSSQLSTAVAQLEQRESLMEDRVKGEKHQRLIAEQKCEELSSQLSAAVSELEQGQVLAQDSLTEVKQERLLAEQKCEEMSGQLSFAVSQLEQGQALAEDRLQDEKRQRLIAEEKCEKLSSQLSAAVSQLEQGQALAEVGLKEEKQQRLIPEQNCAELSSQLSAAVSELQQAQCLVEALEGQQLFSINELEDLQSEHTKLLRKMKQREEEEGQLRKQFQDESNLDDPAVSILEQKLLRARRGKEEARRLNRQFQEEKASRMALEKEREATMSEVETQAALAITTLQSEILELREEVSLAVESEATAKLRIAHLQQEVETLQQTTGRLEDNNRLLSDTSARCKDQVDEKTAQLRALEAQWESASSKLMDYLADGDRTLTEAAKVMDEINHGKVQTDSHNIVQNEDRAAAVYHHLHDVHLMVREAEGQVRALGDAAATPGESTGSMFEDGEALIRESEKKSMVAFLMVRELLERIKDLESAQHRLVEENQHAYSKEAAKDLESAALQQQLEEVRRQLGELNDDFEHGEALIRESEKKSTVAFLMVRELLERIKDLESAQHRLVEENQHAYSKEAAKDLESAALQQQLEEVRRQFGELNDEFEHGEALIRESEKKSTVAFLMVRELLERNKDLESAQHRLVEEDQQAYSKDLESASLQQQLEEVRRQFGELNDEFEHGEALIRESEKKSTVAFFMVRELLERIKDLEAAQHRLVEENQHAYSKEAAKDLESAALQQQLEEVRRQFGELNDEFEHGEALIRESEKKSTVAFFMVRELLERIKDLESAQHRLVEENQQAYSKEVAKDLESAALQQQLEEVRRQFGELNDEHQVVVRKHEDFREEYDRSSVELGTANELQTKNVRLEEELQDSRRALVEKDEEYGNLHKQLDEIQTQSAVIADRYQVLMATHDNLEQVQVRHLEDQALKAEEGEHLIRLLERKAMAALVMVEQLVGSKNELNAANMTLTKEVQDGHALLAEKQAAFTTLQQKLEEIADQYQLLGETHADLQQEIEMLLAEKALRAAASEIASAEALSTEGALKNEVQRLEWSLKQAECRVSEMLTAVTALTVAKEELELERSRLVEASSQAEMNCREKEHELISTQGDLAGVLASVAEAELREKSIFGQLEEFAGAKTEWEVDRAVLKQEIDEMRKEKAQLQFELNHLNAEVGERETAIFESFRRSQEAFELMETRLTAMDEELGGLGAVEENLKHSIAFLESASTFAVVAFEESKGKCLEMERRVQNAEVQMSEMQTATDLAIAQFILDRENWEVEQRTVKLENDARATELRDEIAAAELKLMATEGFLKTAVENVEALAFRKIALEEEVHRLHEDAKISLLKVTEQQQEVDSLRQMSIAFKAECEAADDSIAALNELREQYILAEGSWRSEQELLTRKLEDLEITAGLQSREGGGKELSDDSTDGGQFSQCVHECIAQSEEQKPSEEFQQLQRQQQDNRVLRTIISEKERTILSAKKELQIAVANCNETEVEMDKVHLGNRRLTQIELENKSLIDILSVKLRMAEEELLKRDRKIEGCEVELLKVAGIISAWETKMQDAESEWRRDKEVLAQELTEARLVANEKKTEAASILQKFQDGQATLKEAEYLMDALVEANESAKHDALDWKTERERLGSVQGWWMPERGKLVSEIARLETDMHIQQQDVLIICKEAVIGLVGTMDVLSSVEQELHELKNDHQEEMEHLVGEMKVLKDDLVSRLQFPRDLQLEQLPTSTDFDAKLETMSRMPGESENSHCDREEALKMTLLALEHSRSELASVHVTVCHLQAELENQSKAVRDYHEKLRSADEENVELLKKYNHGVMQWEDEREECLKQLMEERLKEDSLCVQLEETREARVASLSENAKLQSCLKAAEHSYATCSGELLALTKAVSAEDFLFKQLEIDAKRLLVDIQEVTDQTLVVLVDELRADHEETRNITCQMVELGDEVVELGNLCTAIVHEGQRQLADLTKERQSNQFVQLYQQELEFTREILTGSLALSETLVSQLQEISFELEDLTSMQGVGTMNIKFRSDFRAMKVEILNFQKTAEEEFRVWTLRRNITGQENERLMATVQDFETKNSLLNSELDERRHSIDILEEALVLKEQKISHSLQMLNSQLKAVEKERDRYQTDLVVLNEQLDMAQSLADERDLVAAEARQAAELNKSHAEQKEAEARILERSVEELESTVYALETQLGIVRRESERQRVEREALEKNLETSKHQMGLMQLTIDRQEAQTVRGLQDAEASKTELDRMVIEMQNQQIQARKSVESLQQECAEKDVQLRSCKAYISELVLGAEKQASENQQKLKTLEAMVEHLKVEDRKGNPSGGFVGKAGEKSTGKVKGAGSPFKCIGSGLEKQRSSDMDEELSAAKKRIKELESVSASRQKEVFMLNTKLAEAESMTHDVIRDLLGVKVDIASYASLLNQQQVQRIAERARRRTAEAQEKEEELDTLRDRLNEFIEERESWLEEINRRQAEAVAARVSAEKLRLRDQTLTTENQTFREDCLVLRKKVTELEDEIKKLSGQQNLQQRIHHHAKIKEENNSIRLQNEDLSGKLRRMEILFTRVNDELARYRTAEGKSAFLNFDEEARLQKKLQETEENRLQLAETLIGLCAGIMQAAGIQRTSRDLDPSAAITVLQQLQDRQESLERELSDYKLQARIAVEKRRLSDLRDFHTPVKTVSTSTNFAASQQLPSPVSSSR